VGMVRSQLVLVQPGLQIQGVGVVDPPKRPTVVTVVLE
jgi:hypothetical protein